MNSNSFVDPSKILYVRRMTGALVAVGQGQLTVSQLKDVLDAQDSLAYPQGLAAPAHGLFLTRVDYKAAGYNRQLARSLQVVRKQSIKTGLPPAVVFFFSFGAAAVRLTEMLLDPVEDVHAHLAVHHVDGQSPFAKSTRAANPVQRSMTAALCSTCISPLSSATWWPSLESSPASQPAVFLVCITKTEECAAAISTTNK
ncbi:hypothetical protein INR49_002350, partial [Caranx melampygus]